MTETDLAKTEDRLWNWGRWARQNDQAPGRCASAEGRYLPPRLAEGETAAHRTPMPIDVLDAELIERAVVAIPHHRSRKYLVLRYVRRFDRELLRRRVRLDAALIEGFHRRVVADLVELVRSMHGDVVLVRKGHPWWAGVARITRRGV